MSVVPIIASVDDLPNAIRYADRKPSARWYVAKRCEAMGMPELIPDSWGEGIAAIKAAALPPQFAGHQFKSAGKADPAPTGDTKDLPKITDKASLEAAIRGLGSAKDKAAYKAHVVSRAKAIKLPFLIPKGWSAAVTAAVGDWKPNLHPRDREGQFISVGDLLDVFGGEGFDTPSYRGEAVGNSELGGDKVYLSVKVTDPLQSGLQVGDVKTVNPNKVKAAPAPKARLDTPKASTPRLGESPESDVKLTAQRVVTAGDEWSKAGGANSATGPGDTSSRNLQSEVDRYRNALAANNEAQPGHDLKQVVEHARARLDGNGTGAAAEGVSAPKVGLPDGYSAIPVGGKHHAFAPDGTHLGTADTPEGAHALANDHAQARIDAQGEKAVADLAKTTAEPALKDDATPLDDAREMLQIFQEGSEDPAEWQDEIANLVKIAEDAGDQQTANGLSDLLVYGDDSEEDPSPLEDAQQILAMLQEGSEDPADYQDALPALIQIAEDAGDQETANGLNEFTRFAPEEPLAVGNADNGVDVSEVANRSTWSPGDPDPKTDKDYALAVLSEADGYQESNLEDEAQDDRLDAIMTHLATRIEAGADDEEIGKEAENLAEFLADNYGADEDGGLPNRPTGGGGPYRQTNGPAEPDAPAPAAIDPAIRAEIAARVAKKSNIELGAMAHDKTPGMGTAAQLATEELDRRRKEQRDRMGRGQGTTPAPGAPGGDLGEWPSNQSDADLAIALRDGPPPEAAPGYMEKLQAEADKRGIKPAGPGDLTSAQQRYLAEGGKTGPETMAEQRAKVAFDDHPIHEMAGSSIKNGRIHPDEAKRRINDILAEPDHATAHQKMAKLATEFKQGGRQRKRYRELLDQHHGVAPGESTSAQTHASSTAANLRADNPVKDRLAAKQIGSGRRLTEAQKNALQSVKPIGSINATPATLRILVDEGLVHIDQRTGHASLTDKGRAAIGADAPSAHIGDGPAFVHNGKEATHSHQMGNGKVEVIFGRSRMIVKPGDFPQDDQGRYVIPTEGRGGANIDDSPDSEFHKLRNAWREAKAKAASRQTSGPNPSSRARDDLANKMKVEFGIDPNSFVNGQFSETRLKQGFYDVGHTGTDDYRFSGPIPKTDAPSAPGSSFDRAVANSKFQTGGRVDTEHGPGEVTEVTDRSVAIRLDSGESIRVQRGTHGYDRLKPGAPEPPPGRTTPAQKADSIFDRRTGTVHTTGMPPGVTKTRVPAQDLSHISSQYRNGKGTGAFEIRHDGVVIGTIQHGSVGGPVRSQSGNHTVGWASDSTGYLAFDANGKNVRGPSLTFKNQTEALHYLLHHHDQNPDVATRAAESKARAAERLAAKAETPAATDDRMLNALTPDELRSELARALRKGDSALAARIRTRLGTTGPGSGPANLDPAILKNYTTGDLQSILDHKAAGGTTYSDSAIRAVEKELLRRRAGDTGPPSNGGGLREFMMGRGDPSKANPQGGVARDAMYDYLTDTQRQQLDRLTPEQRDAYYDRRIRGDRASHAQALTSAKRNAGKA